MGSPLRSMMRGHFECTKNGLSLDFGSPLLLEGQRGDNECGSGPVFGRLAGEHQTNGLNCLSETHLKSRFASVENKQNGSRWQTNIICKDATALLAVFPRLEPLNTLHLTL